MLNFLFHSLWRVFIFVTGTLILWFTVFELFPYADARLPVYVVLLLLYCFLAYGAIPALIRVFRLVIKPNRIPLYVTMRDGWPSDPVNLAVIVKNRKHLQSAMEKAGWYTADPSTIRNLFRELVSIVFNKPYEKAPFTALYLFNRPHDIGFEIPLNAAGSARTRHHVRFWRLEQPPFGEKDSSHHKFWTHKLRHLLHLEKEIWIGAATEESHAIDIQWHTGQLNHGGNKYSDRERDFIVESLKQTHQVKTMHTTEAGEKIKFRGQQFNVFYYTDGGIQVVRLK
ncbi:LssY C-terminal domain-containing protein [Candidatus Saccharibacteria bacterium]|nr:LssY C-terminal domain-containing protein [Candidatus Saccharibacteria bacterium]